MDEANTEKEMYFIVNKKPKNNYEKTKLLTMCSIFVMLVNYSIFPTCVLKYCSPNDLVLAYAVETFARIV